MTNKTVEVLSKGSHMFLPQVQIVKVAISIGNSSSSCRIHKQTSQEPRKLVYYFWEDEQQMARMEIFESQGQGQRGMPRPGSRPQLWTSIHSKALKQTNTGKPKKRPERQVWDLWGTMLPSWLLVSLSWRTSMLDSQGTSETTPTSGFHVHWCTPAQEKQENKEQTRQMWIY